VLRHPPEWNGTARIIPANALCTITIVSTVGQMNRFLSKNAAVTCPKTVGDEDDALVGAQANRAGVPARSHVIGMYSSVCA